MAQVGNYSARTCEKTGTILVQDSNSRNCGICFIPYPCEIDDPSIMEQWNCNRCVNDSEYAQPYVKGEVLYLQTHLRVIPWENNNFIVDDASGIYALDICDMDGNVIMDSSQMSVFCSDTGSGMESYVDINGHVAWRNAQWFNILTSAIEADCFVVRLTRDFSDMPPQYLYSEPFRRVWCGENTVLMEGSYPAVDENDNFYVTPSQHWGNPVNYKAQVRFTGSMEIDQYAIEKTMIQSKVMSTKKQAVWFVRSGKVPEYVADSIATIVAGQNIYLSEWDYETQVKGVVEVEAETSVDKDNEEGSMWVVSLKLKQIAKNLRTFCSPT